MKKKKQSPWSYFNPKCEVRKNQHGEYAVYAREFLPKGELISLWGGDIVEIKKLDPHMPRFTQRVLQIDEELCILTIEEQEPNDCFNHSCDPNLGFSGQIGLVTMRDVQPGEELTFDYAMSDGSPYDEFDCYCGSPNCRKKVTGNDWQIPQLWKKYDGYFSTYLTKRIQKLKQARKKN
jgi:SET domain-containing protein